MAASPQHRVSTGERLNTAETTGRLQQTLGAKGIRLTRQRRVILQVMDDAEQHLDVKRVLEKGGVVVEIPVMDDDAVADRPETVQKHQQVGKKKEQRNPQDWGKRDQDFISSRVHKYRSA